MTAKKRTATSAFGAGARESHDSTQFYERFVAPEISSDDTVLAPVEIPEAQRFVHGSSADMSTLADGSVALVVTSPPYFVGKQYELEVERDGVPASYVEYLELLGEVFAECKRVLEPGGRIAVNVANLGRKPYRSLSADIIHILQDRLGLLLRGEIIWQKGEGANGSCAWGSFQSAANPVLRDITERVIVASKGRFDRARSKQREAEGLPFESDILADDFMASTLDVWTVPAESATRVGHPAPFPVELPEKLIKLYTFKNDLVVDPFMGSGSSLVAAARLGRRYVGYDLDEHYVEVARRRVAAEAPVAAGPESAGPDGKVAFDGKAAQKIAVELLEEAGFTGIEKNKTIRGTGVTVNFIARDANGDRWYFDVPGGFTSHRGGMQRSDAVWKSLGMAQALAPKLKTDGEWTTPLVFLTTHLPTRPSSGYSALTSAWMDGDGAFFDAIEMLSPDALDRLRDYAARGFREFRGATDRGFS